MLDSWAEEVTLTNRERSIGSVPTHGREAACRQFLRRGRGSVPQYGTGDRQARARILSTGWNRATLAKSSESANHAILCKPRCAEATIFASTRCRRLDVRAMQCNSSFS